MIRILGFLRVLKQGYMVSRPGAWKNVQLWASFIIAVVAVLPMVGLDFSLTGDQITDIATAIVAVLNAVVTVSTTTKIGLSNHENKVEIDIPPPSQDVPGEGHRLF